MRSKTQSAGGTSGSGNICGGTGRRMSQIRSFLQTNLGKFVGQIWSSKILMINSKTPHMPVF